MNTQRPLLPTFARTMTRSRLPRRSTSGGDAISSLADVLGRTPGVVERREANVCNWEQALIARQPLRWASMSGCGTFCTWGARSVSASLRQRTKGQWRIDPELTLARWRADNLTIPGAVDFHVLFCGIGKQQLGKLAWMGERNQVAAWDFVGDLTEAVAC